MRCSAVVLVAAAAAILAVPALAQETPEAQAKPREEKFVVAVLDFDTGSKEIAELGRAVPDLLTVFLTMDDRLQLVERARIKEMLDEMALGASGIVDEESKAKIGQLTGAKFLIAGRVMVVGQQLYVTAKIMSAETGKIGAKMAKGSLDAPLDEIVQRLAESISAYMEENGLAMQPKSMTRQDLAEALKRDLEGKALPKFAVAISERHMTRPIPDPAAETEFNFLLRACGATVINTKDDATSEWAKALLKTAGGPLPKRLGEADVAIVGEGFSEYAGANEKLVSCKARLEVKAVEIESGKILATGRATAAAVDLAENIAAKSALQKAAAEIAAKLIPKAVDEWAKPNAPEE